MGTNTKQLSITDCHGGQNSIDAPMLLPENQVVSAVNVDFGAGGLCRKRRGCSVVDQAFDAGGPFGGGITSLIPHVPTTGLDFAELWAVDDTAVIGQYASTGAAVEWTERDSPDTVGYVYSWRGVSFNGKLFLAYDSDVNRLHCWDGTSHRRVGMATPDAPAAGNDAGAGTYAATVRYYKASFTEEVAGTIVRRSELSAATTITPHGDHTMIVVVKPDPVGEGETHWELWGSADNLVYYLLSSMAVATGSYDDSAAPSSYSSGAVAPLANANLPPPSAKYIVTDGNRLIMAGCWETSGGYVTPKNSRVWWTPVAGASDIGDDERIPLDHYVDLNENDGDQITGLGVHDGVIWVFKLRSVYKLIPTGNDAAPYQVYLVSRTYGAVRQETIVNGEDEVGQAALYFLSRMGPYRITTSGGVQYIGHDWSDVWRTLSPTSSLGDYAHASYHEWNRQVWFWIPNPTTDKVLMVFDTRLGRPGAFGIRGGWSQFTGVMTRSACSCNFSDAPASPLMGTRQTIYLGQGATHGLLYAVDTTAKDGTTTYAGAITTKAYALGGVGRNFGIGAGALLARPSAGTTLTVTASRDYGVETRTATTPLTATGSETAVIRKLEGMDGAGLSAVQFTIGDAVATAATWTLDALVIPYDVEEPR